MCVNYGYNVTYTGVGLPHGFKDHGYCTQIAIFTRKEFMFCKRENLVTNNFMVYDQFVYMAKKREDFRSKFVNSLYYSCNLARSWNYLGNEDPLALKDLFRVPTINVLCDGSLERLRELITTYANTGVFSFEFLEIEDAILTIQEYQDENEIIENFD